MVSNWKAGSASLGYQISSGLGKIFWALVVLVSSAVMLIFFRWFHRFLHPERNSWAFFWADWGAVIGVFFWGNPDGDCRNAPLPS